MRENYAQLYGQVHEPPKIMSDRTGNLTRGVIALKVVRLIPGRDRLSHRASVYALPVLLTKNEKMIQEMMKLKEGDMIEAWGPICTNEIVRRSFCPDCQGENQQSGMQFYVSPIYITQREKGLTPDEGMAALTRN